MVFRTLIVGRPHCDDALLRDASHEYRPRRVSVRMAEQPDLRREKVGGVWYSVVIGAGSFRIVSVSVVFVSVRVVPVADGFGHGT